MVTKHTSTTLKIGILFFFILSLYRVIFLFYFAPPEEHLSFNNVFSTLFLGARFDARWSAIPAMFFLVLGGFKIASPRNMKWSRIFWIGLMTAVTILLIIILYLDFGNFAYLRDRLDAYVFSLMENKREALGMVWESYPVIWLFILLVVIVSFSSLRFKKIFKQKSIHRSFPVSKWKKTGSFIFTFIILGFFIFGRLGQYPLRWSSAYNSRSDFMGKTALNPFETLYNTLKFRKEIPYQIDEVNKGYNSIRALLSMPAPETSNINFNQKVNFNFISDNDVPSNVVIIVCESFAAHMSSSFGNKLNTSPNFDKLAEDGVLFDHCFAPRRGTAYGIFATMTGVPDFEGMSTASANPRLVDQKILFNQLEGYNKMYFIGGSLSWANIRAVLTHNIADLKTYEEMDYKSPRTDIWGVGDYPMMMEANEIFRNQDTSFCAIVQLADNHKPYSIPKEAIMNGFKVDNTISMDTLYKWGFRSIEEYNAYRCFDFSLGAFMEQAQKEKYFSNTLFVLIGDHGLDSKMAYQFPLNWAESGITRHHTPLLFYSPKYLAPQRISTLASQIDVMPSIMGILNKNYEYSALGRNLFDQEIQTDSSAIVFMRGPGFKGEAIGALSRDIYVTVGLDDKNNRMLYNFGIDSLSENEKQQLKDSLGDLAVEYYNTSRYIIRNNKN